MSLSLILTLGLSLILALIATWIVVEPFFIKSNDKDTNQQEQQQNLIGCIELREYLYRELEALEQSMQSGQIPVDVYQREQSELYAKIAECLAQHDSLTNQVNKQCSVSN